MNLEFKAAVADGSFESGFRIVALSENQKRRIPFYRESLQKAISSGVSRPVFSRYFVRESIGFLDNRAYPAGNIEYGLCQAVHGEECALAILSSAERQSGGTRRPLILGVVQDGVGEGKPPELCGNCRDLALDHFGSDCEVVSGNIYKGGTALVAPIGLYFFSSFRFLGGGRETAPYFREAATGIDKFDEIAAEAVSQGGKLTKDIYSPEGRYEERKYSAVLLTENGKYFGAFDLMCDYHPVYPLRDAIRQARRAGDPFIKSVVAVFKNLDGKLPHVLYKDRQHLYELNAEAELVSGKTRNPNVFLAERGDGGSPKRVWLTSVKEWLPIPFSMRSFGEEFLKDAAARLKEAYLQK